MKLHSRAVTDPTQRPTPRQTSISVFYFFFSYSPPSLPPVPPAPHPGGWFWWSLHHCLVSCSSDWLRRVPAHPNTSNVAAARNPFHDLIIRRVLLFVLCLTFVNALVTSHEILMAERWQLLTLGPSNWRFNSFNWIIWLVNPFHDLIIRLVMLFTLCLTFVKALVTSHEFLMRHLKTSTRFDSSNWPFNSVN